MAVMLALLGWRRGALAWLLAVAGTLAAMLVLKLLFAACGGMLPSLGIHSPSGHTAAAAVVYGGLGALLFASPPLALVLSAGAAVLFGTSRVVLGFHSVAEAFAGGLVGLVGTALLVRMAGPPPPRMRNRVLVAALLVVIMVFHGHHVRAEPAIMRFAYLLHVWPLSACRLG